jgi:hypothetical protein
MLLLRQVVEAAEAAAIYAKPVPLAANLLRGGVYSKRAAIASDGDDPDRQLI